MKLLHIATYSESLADISATITWNLNDNLTIYITIILCMKSNFCNCNKLIIMLLFYRKVSVLKLLYYIVNMFIAQDLWYCCFRSFLLCTEMWKLIHWINHYNIMALNILQFWKFDSNEDICMQNPRLYKYILMNILFIIFKLLQNIYGEKRN